MRRKSVSKCSIVNLGKIGFNNGNTSVQSDVQFPFNVKRIFYLYGIIKGKSRGGHAHKGCQQILIAIQGSFEVDLDDGLNNRKVLLNRPDIGLHVPAGIWASQTNFSLGAICLVLASDKFNEEDYIRDYISFKELKYEK